MPKVEPPAAEKVPDTTAAPTADNPEATVSTSTAPIAVDESGPTDLQVEEKLAALLPQYPGVRSVEVGVLEGVVTLDGRVEDAEVRQKVTDVARRVKGVSFVVNKMKTDVQVMTARDLAGSVVNRYLALIERQWLVFLIATGLAFLGFFLAKLFAKYSETLLAPFMESVLLRSVVGSVLSTLIAFGGLMLALQVLDLTQAVLSIVGLAGVVGLAVGFAFRDIAENFIASLLLGIRRPFRVGDFLEIAGYKGIVKNLNTRATVLVTLEGKHVRIPNSTMFKEIMVNSTASPTSRSDFEIVIPFEASTAAAIEAVTGAMRAQDGILDNPPAKVIVTGFDASGMKLQALYWQPSQGVDNFQIKSDVLFKSKVALQKAGIAPAPPRLATSLVSSTPLEIRRQDPTAHGDDDEMVNKPISSKQVKANLAQDSQAAETVPARTNGQPTPAERVLKEAEESVSDEGDNLLDTEDE